MYERHGHIRRRKNTNPRQNANGSFRFPETSLDFSLAHAKQAVVLSLARNPTNRLHRQFALNFRKSNIMSDTPMDLPTMLQQQPERVRLVITTDCEPDDVAVLIAVERLALPVHSVLVVKEVPVQNDTDSPLDRGCVFERFRDVLDAHTQNCQGDCTTTERKNRLEDSKFYYETADLLADRIKTGVFEILESKHIPVVIHIANFLPLYHFAVANRLLAKQCFVAAYGSVNIRWALRQGLQQASSSLMEIINTAFAQCLIFETFGAFGQKNVANPETAPELWERLGWPPTSQHTLEHVPASSPPVTRSKSLDTELREIIADWNDKMVNRQIRDLAKKSDSFRGMTLSNASDFTSLLKSVTEDPKHADHTRVKIIYNILTFREQFVFADIGLMMALMDPVECHHFVPVCMDLSASNFVTTAAPRDGDTGRYFLPPNDAAQTQTLRLRRLSAAFGALFCDS
jgi:uncharacterized protein (UPF0147 family)